MPQAIIDIIVSTTTQGLIYSLLSFGVYITYKILDFPDLTADGSFPLGAAIAAVMLTRGYNPWLSLAAAALAGGAAGFFTGFIHVKFHVRDLLAGIVTMTALFSVNLQIGGANLMVERQAATVFTGKFGDIVSFGLPFMYRKLIASLIIVLAVKFILDLYFKTKSGLLLRAAGDNETLVATLSKNSGSIKILGLMMANALVALSGALVCNEQRSFSSTMGTGQVVFGLATVIIGTTLFKGMDFVKGTTTVIVGSIIYKFCIVIAMGMGLPASMLKLITAMLFLVILILGDLKSGGKKDVRA